MYSCVFVHHEDGGDENMAAVGWHRGALIILYQERSIDSFVGSSGESLGVPSRCSKKEKWLSCISHWWHGATNQNSIQGDRICMYTRNWTPSQESLNLKKRGKTWYNNSLLLDHPKVVGDSSNLVSKSVYPRIHLWGCKKCWPD